MASKVKTRVIEQNNKVLLLTLGLTTALLLAEVGAVLIRLFSS